MPIQNPSLASTRTPPSGQLAPVDGQSKQNVWPELGWYEPSGHDSQIRPTSRVPAGQGTGIAITGGGKVTPSTPSVVDKTNEHHVEFALAKLYCIRTLNWT